MGKYLLIGIVAFILGNIAVLDYLYVSRDNRQVTKQEVTNIIKEETAQTKPVTTDDCGPNCRAEIEKQLSAAAAKVTPSAAPSTPRVSF